MKNVKCDQCNLLMIQHVLCHETGCPNSGARWEDEIWVKYRKCFYCGYDYPEGETCDCTSEEAGE